MNDRLLYVLALFIASGMALWILRRLSPLSLPVLAIGTTLLMGAFYPVASIYIAPRSWRNISNLSEEAILTTMSNYLAFALGLLLAALLFMLFRPGALSVQRPQPEPQRRVLFRDSFVAWALLLFGIALYAEYIRRVGLATLMSTHDFAEKYLASRGLGTFLLGLNVMIVACLWAEAGQVRKRTKWVMRGVALAIVIWATAFIAVRTYAAAVVVGYLAIYCRNRSIQVRQIRLRVVLLLLVGYLGMEGYAILRGSWMATGNLSGALEVAQKLDADTALGGVVGGSELSHPFLTMAEIVQYEEGGTLHGESYMNALLGFVPLAIWPERPMTLAQHFVAEYYPVMDARGAGSAFSFVAEAWLNFGHVFGPLLAGFVGGLFLLSWNARSMRLPHGWSCRFLPYMTYLMVLFHRSQLQASFKQALSALLPCLVFVLIAELAWSCLVRGRSREAAGREAPPRTHALRAVRTEIA